MLYYCDASGFDEERKNYEINNKYKTEKMNNNRTLANEEEIINRRRQTNKKKKKNNKNKKQSRRHVTINKRAARAMEFVFCCKIRKTKTGTNAVGVIWKRSVLSHCCSDERGRRCVAFDENAAFTIVLKNRMAVTKIKNKK